jgi:sialidase-1
MTRVTRRTILAASTAAAATAILPVRKSGAAGPQAEILETKIISRDRRFYSGWPTVCRRASGQLIVTCSGGREAHVCPFGRVEMITSADDGQTWTWPRTLLDGAIDDRDSGCLETAKGTLLVTTFTSRYFEGTLAAGIKSPSNKWAEEKIARWKSVLNRVTEAARQKDLGVWMIRSTDGGLNWSPKYDCLVSSPHGPIQLADGRLLYAGKDLWRPGERVGVAESADDGQTWKWLADISPRPDDKHTEYHELHAVEANDGRIVVQIRNHNKANDRETLQCESKDGGKTWTEPKSIGVWGLPSHLLKLKDGRILMSYGHRRKPFGNQARISIDQCRTWSEPVILSGDGIGRDLGYPSTVELADGTLLTVWYETMQDSPLAVLRQAKWKLA